MQKEEYTAEHIVERWEEIAAIREFDGQMTRAQSERAAYYDLRKSLGMFTVPDVIKQKIRLSEKKNVLANKTEQAS